MNQATSVKPTPVITLISDVCREILANRTSLPSMPDVAARIHGAMQNPNWSVTTVAAIIKGDPGTTAYLLQIANSALYFGVTPILEVERAIARIGVDSTRNLIMAHRVTLGFHVCRGNNRSRWLNSGGYEPIAESLFGSIPVDTFLLEYDTDRSGGFEPLRFIPRGKTVVLGLLTTKDGTLESQDLLLRRIDEAAQYVPLDNLALSPQCGFASVSAGNLLSADEQRRKLELVVATARKVWS